MISLKPRIVSSSFTYLPGVPVNCSATKFGWEEALDAPRARDDELVLVRQLVHAEDGDDVQAAYCCRICWSVVATS